MKQTDWYLLNQPKQIDTPALLVYPDRINHNINGMIRIAGNVNRLIPHIKTHKMPAIVQLQINKGIDKFKCATIAEAEILGSSGVREVILAYQLNQTKAVRYLQLIEQYPNTKFASLVDNWDSAVMLNNLIKQKQLVANVYIDIDNGMHRTGYNLNNDVFSFYKKIKKLSNINCMGLHVYDGHIHIADFEERKSVTTKAFQPIQDLVEKITSAGYSKPHLIAGGTPTFTIHTLNKEVDCSPGTCILWDKGYSDLLPEQKFLHAAVLLTRIISKPKEGFITTDLGHKSVAAENTIDKRVCFLNLKNYTVVAQSEEHLVVNVNSKIWTQLNVGDELYAIPYHICPTVALYDEVQVIEKGCLQQQWNVVARKKRIHF